MADLYDKITGMLVGHMLGDALGSPYEFHPKHAYTGILEHQIIQNTQYQGRREFPIGQCSDDFELSMALCNGLIRGGDYNRDIIVEEYMAWANSKCKFMGTNTRAVFHGIKTLKGYDNRMKIILEKPETERSQSNGSLMRCTPLVIFYACKNIAVVDCSLSNPHPNNIEVEQIYLTMLRQAFTAKSKIEVLRHLQLAKCPEVIAVIEEARQNPTSVRNLVHQRGWCLHAFYCAVHTFMYCDTLQEVMDWCIGGHPKSDTDTNAAISGALMACFLGYKQIMGEGKPRYNLNVIMSCKTDRPAIYTPQYCFEHVIGKLVELMMADLMNNVQISSNSN